MAATQLLLIAIAVVFGSLGAIMGYIITYSEYTHHFPDKGRVRKIALQAATVIFLFFTGIGILLALLLPRLLK